MRLDVATHRVRPLRGVAAPRLRIALVADLHACRPVMGPRQIDAVVARVNGLGPDLVCLLGDYAGHAWGTRTLAPREVIPSLLRLSAPLGMVAVFGNHDWGDDRAAWRGEAAETLWHRAFAEAGIPALVNAARPLEVAGRTITLAGLDSQRAHGRGRGEDDWPAVAAQLDPDRFTILLAHEPDIFPRLPDHVDLTLAGHLHGGQIRLFGRAWICPSRYGTRYDRGLFQQGSRQMVVSQGLGCSGPPLRFGARPEITLVELG